MTQKIKKENWEEKFDKLDFVDWGTIDFGKLQDFIRQQKKSRQETIKEILKSLPRILDWNEEEIGKFSTNRNNAFHFMISYNQALSEVTKILKEKLK